MIEFIVFGFLILVVLVQGFVISGLKHELDCVWTSINMLRSKISRLEQDSHTS